MLLLPRKVISCSAPIDSKQRRWTTCVSSSTSVNIKEWPWNAWKWINLARASLSKIKTVFIFVYLPTSLCHASLPERMDLMLTKVDCKVYRSCMLGDFSIDLFSKSVLHKRSIASTKAYGFHQLMSVSTRPVSEILLNHVLVNCTDNVLESGTLLLTLSDHLPILVSPKSKAIKQQSRGHKPALCRSYYIYIYIYIYIY